MSEKFPKEYESIGALPPGTYVVTFQRMRKIRNKDAYRMHYVTDSGLKITQVVPKPTEDLV